MPDMKFVDSSNIESIGYDPETRELYVSFVNTGRTYVYYNVDQWIFDEFIQADSKGAYLNQNIKGIYEYSPLQYAVILGKIDMNFIIVDTFTDSLTRLTGEEQKAVKTTAFDLQMNPA